MAMVVACFLGERFTASVPVAANRPYWFEPADGGVVSCPGETSVWTMFGLGDEHFDWQDHPGQFGDQCVDFWLTERSCAGAEHSVDLRVGEVEECLAYDDCSAEVRYCRYRVEFGHQRPDYFPEVTMDWLSSF